MDNSDCQMRDHAPAACVHFAPPAGEPEGLESLPDAELHRGRIADAVSTILLHAAAIARRADLRDGSEKDCQAALGIMRTAKALWADYEAKAADRAPGATA